jgi:hypothetical protein
MKHSFISMNTSFDFEYNTSTEQKSNRNKQDKDSGYSRDTKRNKHKPDFSTQRKQKRGE